MSWYNVPTTLNGLYSPKTTRQSSMSKTFIEYKASTGPKQLLVLQTVNDYNHWHACAWFGNAHSECPGFEQT